MPSEGSSELRPPILDDLGLVAAIEWQTQQFQARTGILCQYDSSGEHLDLDQEQSTAIFHLSGSPDQCAPSRKRPGSTSRWRRKRLNWSSRSGITAEGLRGEQGGPLALGLLGMRERAHLIRGRVDLTGIRGQGTTVTLRVPHCSAQRVKVVVCVRSLALIIGIARAEQEQNNDENPCSG